jgi:hypothetical protein
VATFSAVYDGLDRSEGGPRAGEAGIGGTALKVGLRSVRRSERHRDHPFSGAVIRSSCQYDSSRVPIEPHAMDNTEGGAVIDVKLIASTCREASSRLRSHGHASRSES